MTVEINNKSQKSGDNSLNIQSENVTVNTGLSISHVKEIALEIFESNFYKLSGLARETAERRAKEITEKFIHELTEKNPDGIQAADNPDFQHSLFTVQKEYAKCGDSELGDILVDLLVERTKENERTLPQIVLNESLSVAPKLNSDQLDILACCFILFHTRRNDLTNLKEFGDYLKTIILAFSNPINIRSTNYNHIDFVGCGSIRTAQRDIISMLRNKYQAFFSKGYSKELIKSIEEVDQNINKIHIPCLQNNSLIQAGGINDETIREMCRINEISEASTVSLIKINQNSLMNDIEAANFLEEIAPGFEKLLDDARKSAFINMELTSVGIAIAHAHSRKKVGFTADLSIWI